ncbi:metallophosphoesterase family protein [Paenibacillus thalictri]|uniref:Phosphoesterase n=1 Tax=Paenibacillus thalictri TaxID=2527873 RepID=A0A4Q9DTM9_9BACL|nr:metallophosphoesterase [Paenibacillus thalictri]TBL80296.1 metallophosphoesterase [Paenibacillus thalictri]
MRIGVISDTHMPSRSKQLPQALVTGLSGVDLLLHAGDWTSPDVIGLLEAIAPVDGVAGNNDGYDIIDRFGHKKLLTLAGRRIGIVHGHIGSRPTMENALMAFVGEETAPDVIIFGHSHIPHSELVKGILMFNPGSPTDKRFQPRYSYGIIDISSSGVHAEHYFFDSKQ